MSLGLTICGERVALFNAVSDGFNKFDAIAISSNTQESIFPCGACRQVLAEFNRGLKIHIQNKRTFSLEEFLPNVLLQ